MSGALRVGALLRFSATALDARGVPVARRPQSVRADGQRAYKGWVVGWRDTNAASAVPALHWYLENPEQARGDTPADGCMAFDAGDGRLRFYDTVRVHRMGSGRHDGAVKQINAAIKTKDWPKRKFEATFDGKRFVWREGAPAVHKIELRSMFKARAAATLHSHQRRRALTHGGGAGVRARNVHARGVGAAPDGRGRRARPALTLRAPVPERALLWTLFDGGGD